MVILSSPIVLHPMKYIERQGYWIYVYNEIQEKFISQSIEALNVVSNGNTGYRFKHYITVCVPFDSISMIVSRMDVITVNVENKLLEKHFSKLCAFGLL